MSSKKKELISFCVVGIITLPEFQKAKSYVETLYKYYPKKFTKPEIRPMMDVAWKHFLISMQRKHGGSLWNVQQAVAVFRNRVFLSYEKFIEYINKSYKVYLNEDYYELGEEAFVNEFKKVTSNGRKFVYLSVAINGISIGSMLFMLYCDLVPRTCQFFIERCLSADDGWIGTEIIRIQKHSFIQCSNVNLKPVDLPCENYAIPHNGRGVLSTCNFRKHEENSSQFTISLAETPWMDYKYVAFGQLIHGEEVLSEIEHLETFQCSPTESVVINSAGFYSLPCDEETEPLDIDKKISEGSSLSPTTDSALSVDKYFKGLYCLKTDLQSHLPSYFTPEYLLKYLMESGPVNEEEHSVPHNLDVKNQYEEKAEQQKEIHLGLKESYLFT